MESHCWVCLSKGQLMNWVPLGIYPTIQWRRSFPHLTEVMLGIQCLYSNFLYVLPMFLVKEQDSNSSHLTSMNFSDLVLYMNEKEICILKQKEIVDWWVPVHEQVTSYSVFLEVWLCCVIQQGRCHVGSYPIKASTPIYLI